MKSIIVLFSFISLFHRSVSSGDIQPVHLKCEYLRNPLAVDSLHPRLSWTFESSEPNKQNLSQKAYQILVATDDQKLASDIGDLWDSHKVLSDRNTHIQYNGVKLMPKQRAHWKVRVWDQNDKSSEYSSAVFWDKGVDINDWTAEWIGAPKGTQQKALTNLSDIDSKLIKTRQGLRPVLYLRKDFTADSVIKSAKLIATAKGLHKIQINGQNIADDIYSPGFTDYNITIQYRAYDVTNLVKNKQNSIIAKLGTGWYSGYIGFERPHAYDNYGSEQKLLLELHIQYENNQSVVIKTDRTWSVRTGPIIYSDNYMGELYYQSREFNIWSELEPTDWLPVITEPIDTKINLIADRAQPIKVTESFYPKTKREISPGVWVIDFEQEIVGWVAVRVPGNRENVRIQLRHSEALNPDGTIYTLNYRSARSIDTYVFENTGPTERLIEPNFTYHGFRYIEVSGFPGSPLLTDFVGRVIHLDFPKSGHLETSNKLVNKLWENILWSQKGNIWSVPTGCPNRDERIGWTADNAIIVHTASYNGDVSAVYTKWLRDLREARHGQRLPDIAPRIVATEDGAPAWGDAGIIIPYIIWRMYGDIQILEDNYDSMKGWIDFILANNPNYLWLNVLNSNYGDWLEINANTPKDVFDTSYFGYDALLMSKIAKALNKKDDIKKYTELHTNISMAFVKAFVNTTDGKIKGDTQAVYVLALAFELLPENLRPMAANHLVDNIRAHDWHLTTGFISVVFLNEVLVRYGHTDVAYRLLLQDTLPSWGYEIKHNATTMWEHWDTWTEKGFQDPSMNSFNHFGLGSIGRWLYQYMAGIDTDEEEVGFKKIIIKPNPKEGLAVNGSYESINGLITSSWALNGKEFLLNTTIPINTRATVDLRFAPNGKVFDVGSGSYTFKLSVN